MTTYFDYRREDIATRNGIILLVVGEVSSSMRGAISQTLELNPKSGSSLTGAPDTFLKVNSVQLRTIYIQGNPSARGLGYVDISSIP